MGNSVLKLGWAPVYWGKKSVKWSSANTQLVFQPHKTLLVFQVFSKSKENVIFLKQMKPRGMKTQTSHEQHVICHKIKAQHLRHAFGGTMGRCLTFSWRKSNQEICQFRSLPACQKGMATWNYKWNFRNTQCPSILFAHPDLKIDNLLTKLLSMNSRVWNIPSDRCFCLQVYEGRRRIKRLNKGWTMQQNERGTNFKGFTMKKQY